MPRPPIGHPPVTNWPTTRPKELVPVQRVELDTIVVPGY
jgi:hypothetical protein